MYEVFIYCGKYVIDPSWVTVSTLGHIVSSRLRESRHLPCKLKQNEIRHFFFLVWVWFGNCQKLLMAQPREWVVWLSWVIELKINKGKKIKYDHKIIRCNYVLRIVCYPVSIYYLVIIHHMHVRRLPSKKETTFNTHWIAGKQRQEDQGSRSSLVT